jgi:predicted extracellular nuclease
MSRQFARRALVVPVTASLLLASAACDDDDGAARDTEPEEVSVAELESIEEGLAAGDQRISEIADDLEDDDEGFEEPDLLGEAVSVTGEVTTVLDGNGFVLDGDEGAQPGDFAATVTAGILVVSSEPSTVAVGDEVRVVGVVERFDHTSSATGAELDPAVYRDFDGEIALLATSVT